MTSNPSPENLRVLPPKRDATKGKKPVQNARKFTSSRPPALKRNDSNSYKILEPTAKFSEKDVTFNIDEMESPLH